MCSSLGIKQKMKGSLLLSLRRPVLNEDVALSPIGRWLRWAGPGPSLRGLHPYCPAPPVPEWPTKGLVWTRHVPFKVWLLPFLFPLTLER